MSAPFVAEVKIFAGNFAPTGYATCDGQLLPISQNTALFSLLGTTYGGDGKSTFALPNFQGSAPIGAGQGNGLSERYLGEQSGSSNITLLISEMPLHNHGVKAYSGDAADSRIPNTAETLGLPVPGSLYNPSNAGIGMMDPQALTVTGSSFPHNNMQPTLVLLFIIAMQGVFPPRG
jgi:microcystin-dependent protein